MKDDAIYTLKKYVAPFSWAWRNEGIGSWPRRIKYGVRNIVAYWPVIWSDRDWDHVYIARLLAFKLRRMQRAFEKHGHHVGSEHDARRMAICAFVLEREADDFKEEFTMLPDSVREHHEYGKIPNKHDYERFQIARREAREYAFGLMAKHLPTWWD
jgi:hypothetical protein